MNTFCISVCTAWRGTWDHVIDVISSLDYSLLLTVGIYAVKDNEHAIHSEMRPLYGDKWPDEGNAEWTEICLRYGGVVGRSSLACAAADFVFLHRAFTNLLKDGTNV